MMKNIEPKKEPTQSVPESKENDSKKEEKKVYPTIRMEHEFFPELKQWKVGNEYTVSLKLKMVGLSISKFQNNSEFEIHAIDIDAKDTKNKEDK